MDRKVALVAISVLLVLLVFVFWPKRKSFMESHRQKVVIVIPYGRKRYTSVLIPQLLKYRPVVDEIHLWMNTTNKEDIDFAKSIESDFIKLIQLPDGKTPTGDGKALCNFWQFCREPDTIYVRFDDDIILVDDLESFIRFVDFRKEHPEYLLVYGTILNNAVVTHLQQNEGNIPLDLGNVKKECMDEVGWKDPLFAERLHRYILSKNANLKDFYIPNFEHENLRVSINCLSWFGKDFENVSVNEDEEQEVSVDIPNRLNRKNCIFGEYVVVHFGFFTQREHLDKTDILQNYQMILG